MICYDLKLTQNYIINIIFRQLWYLFQFCFYLFFLNMVSDHPILEAPKALSNGVKK